jgi:hypothetical protein
MPTQNLQACDYAPDSYSIGSLNAISFHLGVWVGLQRSIITTCDFF